MNTFDCKMDRDLLVAWDYSGTIYLGEVDSAEIWPGDSAQSGAAPTAGAEGAGVSHRAAGRAGMLGEAGIRGQADGRGGDGAGDWAEGHGADGTAGSGDWPDAALDGDAWAGGHRSLRPSGPTGWPPGPGITWPDSAGRHNIFYEGESLQVYFGDYHNHTSFSDGRAYPDISFLVSRDDRRLDFAAITDHDVTVTPGELAWTGAVAKSLSVPGRFAALHGFEASKGWAQAGLGHWSILFGGDGEVLHFEPGMAPRDLYGFARRLGALAIPHHVGKRFAPHNWDYFDPEAERAVEMCSLHGIFESLRGNEGKADMVEGKFVEDGLARGYLFGFVGGSDSHDCFDPATVRVGLTGVYAAELSPDAVFEAIAGRRTFALTGGRTVVDFRCNGRLMGEELEIDGGGLRFTGSAWSPDSVVSAEIISGGRVVWQSRPEDTDATFSWDAGPPDSPAYYYLRITTAAGDLAWSSPIWVRPAAGRTR
jgi:hypothetical protein